MVLVVLLWSARHRPAGARQPGRDRETTFPVSSTSRSTTVISRRWGTGSRPARRSAATVQTVLQADPRSADSSRQSGSRRSSPKPDPSVQGASRLVRQGPRWLTAPRRQGHVRRLAARPLVCARWHPSRRAGASRRMCSARCVRSGAAPISSWMRISGARFTAAGSTIRRRRASRRIAAAWRRCSRGAGDAFILGCNHPIWPSLGLIHGSRSSNDIKREWKRIADTARQNLMRNWQNGTALVERSRRHRADRRRFPRTSSASTRRRSTPPAG